jgi:hypothetical protein
MLIVIDLISIICTVKWALSYLIWYLNAPLAPLRFHFGFHWSINESWMVTSNTVDIAIIFLIVFIFTSLIPIYRNTTFQIFIKISYQFKIYYRYFSILVFFSILLNILFFFWLIRYIFLLKTNSNNLVSTKNLIYK